MASLLSSRALRTSLLVLPPQLRTTILTRSFSSSTPCRAITPVDIVVAGPSLIINSIHALGIPWYATLPVTAILVRGTLVYYLSSLPSRRAADIHARLSPLASAWALANTVHIRARQEELNPSKSHQGRRLRFVWLRMWNHAKTSHLMGRYFGASWFHPRILLNFGMLVAFTEAIRMKCGSREGLLPLLLKPVEWARNRVDHELNHGTTRMEPKPQVVPVSREEGLAQRLEEAKAARNADRVALGDVGAVEQSEDGASGAEYVVQHATDLTQQSTTATSGLPEIMSAHFDPAMQTEGLRWCTDLTLPDSTFALPFALSIAMAVSIILQPSISQYTASLPTDYRGLLPPFPRSTPKSSKPSIKSTPNAISSTSPTSSTPAPTVPIPDQIRNIFTKLTTRQRVGLSIALVFWFAALKMPAAILLYFVPSILVGWAQGRYLAVKMPLRPPIRACRRPMRMKERMKL